MPDDPFIPLIDSDSNGDCWLVRRGAIETVSRREGGVLIRTVSGMHILDPRTFAAIEALLAGAPRQESAPEPMVEFTVDGKPSLIGLWRIRTTWPAGGEAAGKTVLGGNSGCMQIVDQSPAEVAALIKAAREGGR